MSIRKWLHHLLEPHCPVCIAEREDNKVCQSCETLKTQLEIANYEKKQLLDSLLRPREPDMQVALQIPKEVFPRSIPWRVRQQMLEAEDRKTAEMLRAKEEESLKLAKDTPRGESGGLKVTIPDTPQTVDELEKELGIAEEV